MVGRGKFRKNGKKGKPAKKKSFAHQNRKRKTFSIFGKNKREDEGLHKKPRLETNDDRRSSVKKAVVEKQAVASSEESEDEVEDCMKQLRATFGGSSRKVAEAFHSSEDEEESEDEVEDAAGNEDDSGLDEEEESNDEEIDLEEENEETIEDEETVANEEILEETIEDEETIEEEEEEIEVNPSENVEDDAKDPFVSHLSYELSDSLLTSLQSTPPLTEKTEQIWPKLGKIQIEIPQCEEAPAQNVCEFSLNQNQVFAPKGKAPQPIKLQGTKPSDLFIKSQIEKHLKNANKFADSTNDDLPFSELQAELFAILNNYQDLYFPRRNFANCEEIRYVYCLHAINHVLKIRTKILHHNAKLNRKDDVPEEFRDQGLVRPKILIIVPFRDAAYKVVNTLLDILIPEDKGHVRGRQRFVEDFTGNELVMPKKKPKPEDYEQLFCGNTSDDFKIGLTINKKSVKLYADFYVSDIIVASPLGLRYVIGAEGESERDYDFLASIEFLVLDQSEVFLMQNWDHVIHVFEHLHLQPKQAHGTDFARVRHWNLNGHSKHYRQTLILSSLLLPEINAIFNRKCQNFCGKVRAAAETAGGSIRSVLVQLPHVFQRFAAGSAVEAIDARFDHFVRKVLPQHKDTLMRQTLVYVANYFDYVRLRNYFKKEDVGFVQICEYSKEGKIARARDMFYHGDAHFLLYTERYHFFNRKQIKGIRHLIFYQPPNFPNFYTEMCNLMQEANMNKKVGSASNMTVTVLYSKYDVHQLSAVIGTERALKMVTSDKNVHMLLTDG